MNSYINMSLTLDNVKKKVVYLFTHYVHGLHDAARHQAVVPG